MILCLTYLSTKIDLITCHHTTSNYMTITRSKIRQNQTNTYSSTFPNYLHPTPTPLNQKGK